MKQLWRDWAWVAPFVVAMMGLYIGAYYANVETCCVSENGGPVREVRCLGGSLTSSWGRVIFAPIHMIDRAVRPDLWVVAADP